MGERFEIVANDQMLFRPNNPFGLTAFGLTTCTTGGLIMNQSPDLIFVWKTFVNCLFKNRIVCSEVTHGQTFEINFYIY